MGGDGPQHIRKAHGWGPQLYYIPSKEEEEEAKMDRVVVV